jgi:hypothetical protein
MTENYRVQTKETGEQGRHPLSCVPNSVNRLDVSLVRHAAEKNYCFRKWYARPRPIVRPQGSYNEVKSMECDVTLEREASFLGEAVNKLCCSRSV